MPLSAVVSASRCGAGAASFFSALAGASAGIGAAEAGRAVVRLCLLAVGAAGADAAVAAGCAGVAGFAGAAVAAADCAVAYRSRVGHQASSTLLRSSLNFAYISSTSQSLAPKSGTELVDSGPVVVDTRKSPPSARIDVPDTTDGRRRPGVKSNDISLPTSTSPASHRCGKD